MKYILAFFMVSCTATKTDTPFSNKTSENILNVIKESKRNYSDARDANTEIALTSTLITQDTAEINTLVQNSDLKTAITPLTRSIDDRVLTIKRQSKELQISLDNIDQLSSRLNEANKDFLVLNSKIQKMDLENQQIKQEANKKLYSILAIMFGSSCLIIGAGIFLIIFSTTMKGMGYQLIGLGIFLLCLSAAATKYFDQIALIGIGVVILGMIGTGWVFIRYLIKKNKEVETYSTATHELVELGEAIKQHMPNDSRLKVFGDRAVPGIAQAIQSDTTQKIVSEIRQNGLKKKIMPTIPNNAAGLTG